MRRRGYVDSISEAFERFLRRGAPAWIDRQRLSLPRAVKLLRASGGLPVLAHPGIIRADEAGLERIVREATRLGLAGIECYYPLHDAETVEALPRSGREVRPRPHRRLRLSRLGRSLTRGWASARRAGPCPTASSPTSPAWRWTAASGWPPARLAAERRRAAAARRYALAAVPCRERARVYA